MNNLKVPFAVATVLLLGGVTACASDSPSSVGQVESQQATESTVAAMEHDAYARIPVDQIQSIPTEVDFVWNAKDPYYGFNSVPVVARVHIDSIDGGRTFSPIFNQYTFPQTIGKMTVQTVYKGDLKPGAQLTYNKGGGVVSFDEYWKSLNPQQQGKFKSRNGGQKPTGIQYVKKMYSGDADIKVGKDYIALLLPQQYKDGTAEEYSIQGFQYGFREVRGSGPGATVLNNETNEWESLESMVPLTAIPST
ncbi:hypothetical protein [Paenarthrobacter nicotinovorans]|uniref:hypothetical protein n=1 Tax=Paenarthrobacter nicotinovorans TaxID=29320 RepID=UPI0011A242BB|nr:hypothetical protein [Paenarthrobacter nicotinovorans]